MGLDLVAVLRRLGVSIDAGSPPITEPGVISWLGRVYDVTPDQYNLGVREGMELWTTGQGFAPLDRAGVESWLFDAPRGSHLVIAERRVNFDPNDLPSRSGRNLKLWQLDDFAAFIGHAVIDGRLSITEDEVEDYEEDIEFIAEANAYENLDVYAFNLICWPDYLDTETKVKIFYRYLEVNPLFDYNQNITILKKEKKPNDVMNIIYVFDRENNTINFPNTEMLGFINSC